MSITAAGQGVARVVAGVLLVGTLASGGDGNPVRRVNAGLAPGEDVNLWLPSSDGKRAYYVVTAGLDGGQIFRASTLGNQDAVALSAALPSGRDIFTLELAADGTRLAYTADQDTDQQQELYSVPTDASAAPVKLNGPLAPNQDVNLFHFTPDGTRVLFLVDYTTLWSVPADGSAAALQLASLVTDDLLPIAPDSSRVVFLSMGRVFSVPTDGSAGPVQLSGTALGEQALSDYQITPDGARVIYRAWTFSLATGDPINWIFSVPIDGSAAPVLLFPPILDDQIGHSNPRVYVTADSSRVVYRTEPTYSLLSAPVDGSSAAVRLDPAGGRVDQDCRLSADGRVVFRFAASGSDPAIHVVPADGSQAAQRLTPFAGPIPIKWELAATGWVVFDGYRDDRYELYGVPLAGGPTRRLSSPMVAGGGLVYGNAFFLESFIVTPDGRTVVYQADQDSDETFELHAVPTDGHASATRVNASLVAGGDTSGFWVAPNSARLLYGADQSEDARYELFTTILPDDSLEVESLGEIPSGMGIH
jgi:hypothetical protein